MKKTKKAAVIVISALIIALPFIIFRFHKKNSFEVSHKYSPAFSALCAVVGSDSAVEGSGGSGVLLPNGYVLTARHCVDENKNGLLDDDEYEVKLQFYYPRKLIVKAHVVYMPPSEPGWRQGENDYAILSIDNPPHSNFVSDISLISDEDYYDLGVGCDIYAIGRPAGSVPTITTGNLSSPSSDLGLDRKAQIDVWYGNSGGGVYDSDGRLIGIVVSLRSGFMGIPVPGWANFLPISEIRKDMSTYGVDTLLEEPGNNVPQYNKRMKIAASIVLGIVCVVVILKKKLLHH